MFGYDQEDFLFFLCKLLHSVSNGSRKTKICILQFFFNFLALSTHRAQSTTNEQNKKKTKNRKKMWKNKMNINKTAKLNAFSINPSMFLCIVQLYHQQPACTSSLILASSRHLLSEFGLMNDSVYFIQFALQSSALLGNRNLWHSVWKCVGRVAEPKC